LPNEAILGLPGHDPAAFPQPIRDNSLSDIWTGHFVMVTKPAAALLTALMVLPVGHSHGLSALSITKQSRLSVCVVGDRIGARWKMHFPFNPVALPVFTRTKPPQAGPSETHFVLH
jgi:hypothetical protein